MQIDSCKNCDHPFHEDVQFCPNCGQKVNEKLTLSELFYNTVTNYFSFDAKLLKSIIPLLFRPGYLARRFVDGKRQRYLHPGNFYLFVSVTFFILNSSVISDASASIDKALKGDDKDSEVVIDSSATKEKEKPLDSTQIANIMKPLKTNQKAFGMDDRELEALDSVIAANNNNSKNNNFSFGFNEKGVDSLIEAGASDAEIYKFAGMDDDAGFLTRKFYEKRLKFHKNEEIGGGAMFMKLYESIPGALFFLLPIFALLFKIFYYKKGPYSHHLVFSLYFFAFLFSIGLLVILTNRLVDIPDWIDWLIVLSTFFYLVASAKYFYRSGWFSSFLKSSVITFLYMAILIPMAFSLAIAYVFLMY